MTAAEEKASGAYQAMVALGDAVAGVLLSATGVPITDGKVLVLCEDLTRLAHALGKASDVLARLGGDDAPADARAV